MWMDRDRESASLTRTHRRTWLEQKEIAGWVSMSSGLSFPTRNQRGPDHNAPVWDAGYSVTGMQFDGVGDLLNLVSRPIRSLHISKRPGARFRALAHRPGNRPAQRDAHNPESARPQPDRHRGLGDPERHHYRSFGGHTDARVSDSAPGPRPCFLACVPESGGCQSAHARKHARIYRKKLLEWFRVRRREQPPGRGDCKTGSMRLPCSLRADKPIGVTNHIQQSRLFPLSRLSIEPCKRQNVCRRKGA